MERSEEETGKECRQLFGKALKGNNGEFRNIHVYI